MATLGLILGGWIMVMMAISQLGALRQARHSDSDRKSATLLVASWYAVLAISAAQAIAFPVPGRHAGWVIAGITSFALGMALRWWAVRTLDRHFSPLVELQPDHQLITHGPYAWVRHPAYLGSALWGLALPCLFASPAGVAAIALAYAPALIYRVRVEERMLAAAFGPAWEAYRARVPALLPLRAPLQAGTLPPVSPAVDAEPS